MRETLREAEQASDFDDENYFLIEVVETPQTEPVLIKIGELAILGDTDTLDDDSNPIIIMHGKDEQEICKDELDEPKTYDYDKEYYDPKNGNLLQQYFGEAGGLPLLTAKEEQQLGGRIQKGLRAVKVLNNYEDELIELSKQEIDILNQAIADYKKAKDDLINHNLKLVVSIAKRYNPQGMQFMDLVQEGNTGLMTATEKFDPTRGIKFSTYATWWIRQAITRAIANQNEIIRLPVHVVEQRFKIRRAYSQLKTELYREPTASEISTRSGLDEDKINVILQVANRQPESLDEKKVKSASGSDEKSLADFVGDKEDIDSDGYTQELTTKERQDYIKQMVVDAELNDREQLVISLRYSVYFENLEGLIHCEDGTTLSYHELYKQADMKDRQQLTLQQMSSIFGVSRERIRQIEAKALDKLLAADSQLSGLDIISNN